MRPSLIAAFQKKSRARPRAETFEAANEAEKPATVTAFAVIRIWSLGTSPGIVLLAAAALFAAYDRELPAYGNEQGILLASIAVERASGPNLRALATLMAASQSGESRIFAHWWKS